MAKTLSSMIPLGTKAPPFTLLDVRTNLQVSLEDVHSSIATVVMFICNHCPYVKHIQPELVDVVRHYQTKGISFVAICANDAETYPDDSPENMRIEAERHHYTFPYLHDEMQTIAKAYHATCTPDFFIFDKNLSCVYRGRFDDATPGNSQPVTGKDLCQALDNLLIGKSVNQEQHASMGCNIKWRKAF